MRPRHLLATVALIALASPLLAAMPPRVSPHDCVYDRVGTGRAASLIEVVYGRPYSKDPKSGDKRKIWGTLVPFGKVWRMGSDEATLFITSIDLTVGDTTIPAGTYTLDMQPEEDGSAKLIINKTVARWGIPYTPALEKTELARLPMTKSTLDKDVDQFTITLAGAPDKLTLNAQWETTQYAIDLNAKK